MGGKLGKLNASHGQLSVLKKERENEIANRVCNNPREEYAWQVCKVWGKEPRWSSERAIGNGLFIRNVPYTKQTL